MLLLCPAWGCGRGGTCRDARFIRQLIQHDAATRLDPTMSADLQASGKPDTTSLDDLYDAKNVRGITAIEGMGLQIHHSSLVGLKAANEDRIAIQECDLGLLIAVFDGALPFHCSAESALLSLSS